MTDDNIRSDVRQALEERVEWINNVAESRLIFGK